jgi:hypothetical protein
MVMDEINVGGRPRIEFTDKEWSIVENACKIQCTGEEIASLLEIDYDTMNTRIKERFDVGFSDYIKRFSLSGKTSLRRLQWKAAEGGNSTMLIWLGKQYLDQSDKQQVTADVTTTSLPNVSIDEFI